MGGGVSRSSYDEYVEKRRSKETFLFMENKPSNLMNNTNKNNRLSLQVPDKNRQRSRSVCSNPQEETTLMTSAPSSLSLSVSTYSSISQTMRNHRLPQIKYRNSSLDSSSSNSGDESNYGWNDQPISKRSPKYALVRKKSKNSDNVRSTIRKIQE